MSRHPAPTPAPQSKFLSAGFALLAGFAAAPCGADTRTFANPGVVTINDSTQPFRIVPATPYPSIINVTWYPTSETIEKVTVTLHNLRHGTPDDIDMLLVGPGGQNVIILSDAGGGFADPAVPITITLDDVTEGEISDNGPEEGSLGSGIYRPVNFNEGVDVFPAPAPIPSLATALAAFAGTDPNGDWKLFLVDDDVFDGGSIADGWSLTIVSHGSVPPGSFAGWASGFGLSVGAAAAHADPDGDGIPNAVEYIIGGNPTASATSGRPTAISDGANILLTFLRDDASETSDVTLTVEWGTDLVIWPGVFTIGPNANSSSPGVSITENGEAPDSISVAIPIGTDRAKFARLNVRLPP